jgi:hypothetical protein
MGTGSARRLTSTRAGPRGIPTVIDEIIEKAVPWGVFIGLGALIGAAFPGETRATAKRLMLTGFRAADWVQGMGAEAFEKGQDVVAEARLEYEQQVHEAQREAERRHLRVMPAPAKPRPTSSRGGRRTRRSAASPSET